MELAEPLLIFDPLGFEMLVVSPDFVPGPFSDPLVAYHLLCLFPLLELVKVLAILGELVLNIVEVVDFVLQHW